MKSRWIYNKPIFEGDRFNEILLRYAPWSGLRLFVYDLVSFFQPNTIVELGSHYGCSSFTFLQAIKDKELDTEFYAIDTWEGDAYTKYSDVENVFEAYSIVEKSVFCNQKTKKIRMTFNEAAKHFPENSIDLLHIDGSHRYEDIQSDFETWYGKVKKNGIILIHDIGKDLVDRKLMGSHFFWNDLKEKGVYTLEIPFSCGLGIVSKQKKTIDDIKKAFSIDYYQNLNDLEATKSKEMVRKQYFRIMDQDAHIEDLLNQIKLLREHINHYERDTSKKDSYIKRLEKNQKALVDYKNKTNENKELKKQINNYKKTICDKDDYISDLESQIRELNSYAENKEKYSNELIDDCKKMESFLLEKEEYLKDLETQKQSLTEFVDSKEEYISELKHDVYSLNNLVDAKEDYISELESQLNGVNGLIDQKEKYIKELIETIKKYEIASASKEKYIKELERDRDNLNKFSETKEDYINELHKQIDDLNAFAESKEQYIQELIKNKDINNK